MRLDQNVCPTCHRRITPFHYADTGNATTLPDGACPTLFERRRPSQPVAAERHRPQLVRFAVGDRASMLVE